MEGHLCSLPHPPAARRANHRHSFRPFVHAEQYDSVRVELKSCHRHDECHRHRVLALLPLPDAPSRHHRFITEHIDLHAQGIAQQFLRPVLSRLDHCQLLRRFLRPSVAHPVRWFRHRSRHVQSRLLQTALLHLLHGQVVGLVVHRSRLFRQENVQFEKRPLPVILSTGGRTLDDPRDDHRSVRVLRTRSRHLHHREESLQSHHRHLPVLQR